MRDEEEGGGEDGGSGGVAARLRRRRLIRCTQKQRICLMRELCPGSPVMEVPNKALSPSLSHSVCHGHGAQPEACGL